MKKPRKLNAEEKEVQELFKGDEMKAIQAFIELRATLGKKMEELARILRKKEELEQELNGSRKESQVLRTEIHRLEGEVIGVERAFKIILANTSK